MRLQFSGDLPRVAHKHVSHRDRTDLHIFMKSTIIIIMPYFSKTLQVLSVRLAVHKLTLDGTSSKYLIDRSSLAATAIAQLTQYHLVC